MYERMIHGDSEAERPGSPDAHDAVFSIGGFGLGHRGPEAMAGLANCAKPGVPVVIFMSAEPFVDQDYSATLSAMERDGMWRVASITDHNYIDALNRPGKLIVAHRGD